MGSFSILPRYEIEREREREREREIYREADVILCPSGHPWCTGNLLSAEIEPLSDNIPVSGRVSGDETLLQRSLLEPSHQFSGLRYPSLSLSVCVCVCVCPHAFLRLLYAVCMQACVCVCVCARAYVA